MQFQSDILSADVVRPQLTEVTAIGAAYLAGLAVGYWENLQDIQEQWQIDRVFKPSPDMNIDEEMKNWNRAVETAKAWSNLEDKK